MVARAKVFLSHSAADKGIAGNLRLALERSGYPVWSDENINFGENFVDRITKALGEARTIIFLMTPNSENSPNTWFELGIAHAMSSSNNSTILPVLVGGRLPSSLDGVVFVDGREFSGDELAQKVVAAVISTQQQGEGGEVVNEQQSHPIGAKPGFSLPELSMWRAKAGISLMALAREAQVDSATIRRIESGRPVRRETCNRIVDALRKFGLQDADVPRVEEAR